MIFCQIEIMRQNNIIYFFSPWQNFQKDWKLLGDDLVTHVWADDEQVIWCFADPDKCLKTDKNPTGMLVTFLTSGVAHHFDSFLSDRLGSFSHSRFGEASLIVRSFTLTQNRIHSILLVQNGILCQSSNLICYFICRLLTYVQTISSRSF
jgi:hypothetical protein